MRKKATKDVTNKEMEECEKDIARIEKALKELEDAALNPEVKEARREHLLTELNSRNKRLELFKKPGTGIKST